MVVTVAEHLQTLPATEQLQKHCQQLLDQLGVPYTEAELKVFIAYVVGLEPPPLNAEKMQSIYDQGTHERKRDSLPARVLAYLSQYVPSHIALGSFALRSVAGPLAAGGSLNP